MASTSETGHAKNIANFQTLISFLEGYGTQYNPSKPTLTIQALNTQLAEAQEALSKVVLKNTEFNNKVNSRVLEFDPIKPLATRLVNALQVTDASTETIKDAKSINRKLHGKRTSQITAPVDPNAPAPKTISASQQSYDQQIQHFAALISILEAETSYSPNETELTITALTEKQTALNATNVAVGTAYVAVSNSRLLRDNIIYNPQSGIVKIASEVKKYIKSAFGATSAEYNQVKGIEIRKVKN